MRTKVLNHFHTFHPEAQAEFNRLAKEEREIQLKIARRGDDVEAKPRRMSEATPNLEADLAKVRERMDELRAVIASGVVRITLRSLPRRTKDGSRRSAYRRLMLDHPPRDDEPYDQGVGYNVDTFGEALIQACILKTETLDGEPVDNDWDRWADDMSDGQWQEFFLAAKALNEEGNPATFPR